MSNQIAQEYQDMIDGIIREMVTRVKPYAKELKFNRYFENYWKYRKAWEDFKEYNSHVCSVLLERFMV